MVIGGSAGALQPLKTILKTLPADLPAVVIVVVHLSAETPSEIARSMADVGPLPAVVARHGEPIEHGHIYVAPPDHHLLLGIDGFRVVRGPHENRVRPAIDPTLRSAANVFDGRVVATILSGQLNDGTYGAMMVKARGGTVIAQDPAEAEHSSMPSSIVERSLADYVLKTSEIAPRLASLVWSRMPERNVNQPNPADSGSDELERVSLRMELPAGEISPYPVPSVMGRCGSNRMDR